MKSILFFIESLDGGGAENALENIVTKINKNLFDVHVVSETDNEMRTARIKQNSRHHCFVHKNINNSKVRSLVNKVIIKFSLVTSETLVRKVLIRGKYDIEVASCEGYATKIIGNSKNKNCKKIAWIHTDFINNPWSEAIHGGAEMEKKCYENFDVIVCVAETLRDSFVKKYGMSEKVKVIHNIIDSEKVIMKSLEPLDFNPVQRPMFMLAGSFRPVKGYDRMVRVCAKLKSKGYSFSVIIMGIGYERDNIETLLDELNMRDTITLMDYQPNPYNYMTKADAFVCSSIAEGYSTVVSEAIVLGLPVITTECSGMREIFGENKCGIICENSEEGLYSALESVLANPQLLEDFRNEEKIRARDFNTKQQLDTIEHFLGDMIYD